MIQVVVSVADEKIRMRFEGPTMLTLAELKRMVESYHNKLYQVPCADTHLDA